MKLYLHNFSNGVQVLKSAPNEEKFSAQSNTTADKFNEALNNPNNTIIKYEESPEYAAEQANAAKAEKLAQIEEIERKQARSAFALILDPSANAERGILQDFEDQKTAIRNSL